MWFSCSQMLHRTLSNDLGASLSSRAWVCASVSRGGQRSLLLSRPRASGQAETSSVARQTLVTTPCLTWAVGRLLPTLHSDPVTSCCRSWARLPHTVLLDQRLRPQARPEVLPLAAWPHGLRVTFPRETRVQAAGSQRPRTARAVGCAVGSSPWDPGRVGLSAPRM